jgi:hypothetical protein
MTPQLVEILNKHGLIEPMINKAKIEARLEGKLEGQLEGKANDIINVLAARFEAPPKKLQNQIKSVKNIEKLDELIKFAGTCVSIGEFSTAFN